MTLSTRQAALARQKRLRLKKTQCLDAVLAVAAVAFTAVAFKCDELLAARPTAPSNPAAAAAAYAASWAGGRGGRE